MKAQQVVGRLLPERCFWDVSLQRPVLEEEGLKSDPSFSLKKVGEMEIKRSADKEMKMRTQNGNENPNLDEETKSLFLEKNAIYQSAASLTGEEGTTECTQSRRRGLLQTLQREGRRVF